MKRIIIVHGWSGSPEGNWIPWLKNELEKSGCEVIAPAMPDSDNPVIEKWVGCLAEVVGQPDEETYFVGHSIGCQTILRYFDRYNFGSEKAIGGAVFVAGWFNLENLEGEEIEIAKPWLETSLNIANIKAVLPKSTLIISDNDPYGAFEENKEKFEKLGAEIIVLHDAGHITAGDGFTEVPIILEEVLKFWGSSEAVRLFGSRPFKNADLIYVIDGGKIIESGSHKELMQQKRANTLGEGVSGRQRINKIASLPVDFGSSEI